MPPTTPAVVASGGGASSSLNTWTFAGILVGVRSCPFAMLLATFSTFGGDAWDTAGGGGASSKVSNCCLGSTSVNHNESKSRKPSRSNCRTNERSVACVLLVRCPTLEPSRLSSNRALSRAAETRGLKSERLGSVLCALAERLILVNSRISVPSLLGKAITPQKLLPDSGFIQSDSHLMGS